MSNLPRATVGVYDCGHWGWRVCVYQPAPPRDSNAMGWRLAEVFCRSEASARKLAARWARDYGAELLV